MKLYDIKEEIEHAIDEICVDEDTGEIISTNSADEKMLELLKVESDAIESIALSVKNITAETEALGSEVAALTLRRKNKVKKAEYLRAFLSEYMVSRGIPKYETPKCVLSFRKSEQLEITDMAAFLKYANTHDDLLRYKDPEPKKDVVKSIIKEGKTVPGAEIVTNHNLQLK